jgi:hypothetical protein
MKGKAGKHYSQDGNLLEFPNREGNVGGMQVLSMQWMFI